MKRIFSIIMCALAAYSVSGAEIVQKVELKNGSVLEGYIQSQDGSSKMTVHTEKALIIVSSSNADVFDRQVKYNQLDQTWKDWGAEHDAFSGTGDNRILTLNEVSFKEDLNDSVMVDTAVNLKGMNFERYLIKGMHSANNVKVLERGVTVKYLELTPNSYVVAWSDIKAIRSDRRQKTALSGINRIYELKNGRTYEGQYAGETDNSLSLYMDNGMVQSFKSNDVVKYTFRPINPNQDIFEQSPLVDIIRTVRGAVVRGIILEQNYASKKDSENLFLIQTSSGAIQTIKVSEIAELRKEENPKYAPKFDLMLNNGDVVINRKPVNFVKVVEEDDVLVLDSIGKMALKTDASGKAQITVEYRLDDNAGLEAFQLVKVTETKVKKQMIYSFSYKDLVNAVTHAIKIETSVNKTTKAEYELYRKGVYALYDAKKKRAIPFIVQ